MLSGAPVMAVIATTDLTRAHEFYGGRLGLEGVDAPSDVAPGARIYRCGGDTTLLVYQRPTAGDSAATSANFVVDDVPATVRALREAGVTIEEYDFEGLKTEDGVATIGDFQSAWFKDPDGNILAVTSAPGD